MARKKAPTTFYAEQSLPAAERYAAVRHQGNDLALLSRQRLGNFSEVFVPPEAQGLRRGVRVLRPLFVSLNNGNEQINKSRLLGA